MFAGFNLTTTENFNMFQKTGEMIFNESRNRIQESLDKFLKSNGSINGIDLQEHWFPQINADIFISHSHKDEKMVKGLAGWLYENFKLKAFIDSCVWGYSLDLQKEIDREFCAINEDKTLFNYDSVMNSTSHVHMMLSTSLTQMLDKCECVFFLNTPNSLNTEEVINNTKSPWIYHEISITQLIRKRNISHYRAIPIKEGTFESSARALDIEYNIELNHLVDLNTDDLINWSDAYNNYRESKFHPLDILYNYKKVFEKEKQYGR